MNETVSSASIFCMAIAGLISFCIPVALFFYFRKKKHADILPFFIGMAVMFVFALVVESLVHQLVLNVLPVGKTIMGNIWLYALYGGLMAGLFEETGRFVAFKTILKKYRDRDIDALMYGAGHEGFEAAAVFGATMISNIVIAVMINSGMTSVLTQTATAETLPQIEAMLDSLKTTAPYTYFIGLIERFFAIALQLSLSVLVWFAAKDGRKWILYPLAILLHLFVDGALVIAAHYFTSYWIIYAILLIETAIVVLTAFAVWKRNAKKESINADQAV